MRGLRAQLSATRRSVWSLSVAYEDDASVLGRSNLQRELGFITTVHSDLPPWRLPALRGHDKTFDLGLSAKRFQRSGGYAPIPGAGSPLRVRTITGLSPNSERYLPHRPFQAGALARKMRAPACTHHKESRGDRQVLSAGLRMELWTHSGGKGAKPSQYVQKHRRKAYMCEK